MSDPKEIERHELGDCDQYMGTREQLIAAGIVKEEQFPPPGKCSISYSQGKPFRGRCRKDETYLRIYLWPDRCGVWVGVHPDVAAVRKRKADEEARAHRAQRLEEVQRQDLTKKAAAAQSFLDYLPRSEMAFRRRAIQNFREYGKLGAIDVPKMAPHGYSFDAASVEAILIAMDAVVEAIMNAQVNFDQAAHIKRLQELQADVVRADPTARTAVARIVQPNPAVLAGERL